MSSGRIVKLTMVSCFAAAVAAVEVGSNPCASQMGISSIECLSYGRILAAASGGSMFRGTMNSMNMQAGPSSSAADMSGARILPPPKQEVPNTANKCAQKLKEQCGLVAGTEQNNAAWNRQVGWTQLLAAANTMTGVCNSNDLSFEAWNYCKCGWFPSKEVDRQSMIPESRGEPRQLTVRIELTPYTMNVQDPNNPEYNVGLVPSQVKEAINGAVAAFAKASGVVKTGIVDEKGKQSLDIGTSEKEAVYVHTYDTTSIEITWYLQNTVSIGKAFYQLSQLMKSLERLPLTIPSSSGLTTSAVNLYPEVSKILLDMESVRLKREICDDL